MKMLKWVKIIQWIMFLVSFFMWQYVLWFVGEANSYIDDVCMRLSCVLFLSIEIRYIVTEIIIEEIKYTKNKKEKDL